MCIHYAVHDKLLLVLNIKPLIIDEHFVNLYNHFKPIATQIVKVVVFLPVPCVPNNVSVLPSCDDNGATVTWSSSLVATSYLLTATGRDGHVAVCNSTANNCTLAHLYCGQPYSLSVTAKGEKCTSQPSVSSFRSGKGTLAWTLGSFCLPQFLHYSSLLLSFLFLLLKQSECVSVPSLVCA